MAMTRTVKRRICCTLGRQDLSSQCQTSLGLRKWDVAKWNVSHRQEVESRWDAIATEYPNAPGSGPGRDDDANLQNPAFKARLDKLLASAIEEQEREQQGFMKVLQASRDALTSVRTELDLLRGVVEKREQAVVDLLDDRLSLAAREETMEALQHRIELLEGEQASLKKALSVKLDAIARSLEAVEWRTQEGMSALANRVGELQSSFGDGDLTATTVAALKELGENIETRQQEVAEAILKALDPVGRIMQVVQSRLVRAASELAVAQGSLFARLAEREERLERQRDQILADLLDEFAGVAKPRERNRIAAGLREADDNRKQRRNAGRTRKRDDSLPPPPLDAYGVGMAGGQPPPGGNYVSGPSGPHQVSAPAGPHDLAGPAPVREQGVQGSYSPEEGDAGRRGRRGRKPPL
ncbi:MAG: hypothetical protein QOH66_2745 [Actinomycetota bacterium]|nr:hypothetical protein [Actinomycetota bacterium]